MGIQELYSEVAYTSVNSIIKIILGLLYNLAIIDGINFLLEALSAAIMD